MDEGSQHNVREFESVQHDCQLLWGLSVHIPTGQSSLLLSGAGSIIKLIMVFVGRKHYVKYIVNVFAAVFYKNT